MATRTPLLSLLVLVAGSAGLLIVCAVAARSQDLDGLAQCKIRCLTAFNRCRYLCADYACRRDCAAAHLLECNCVCADRIPFSSPRRDAAAAPSEARPLYAWRHAVDAMTDVTVAAALNSSDVDATQYERYVNCYRRHFRAFSVCAGPCGSTPATANETCIFECARRHYAMICGCVDTPSGGADVSGFLACRGTCLGRYRRCWGPCATGDCRAGCELEHLSCTCASCRPYLQDKQAVSSTWTTPRPAAAATRGGDDAAAVRDCVAGFTGEAAQCADMCPGVDACRARCWLRVYDAMCLACGGSSEGSGAPGGVAHQPLLIPALLPAALWCGRAGRR